MNGNNSAIFVIEFTQNEQNFISNRQCSWNKFEIIHEIPSHVTFTKINYLQIVT